MSEISELRRLTEGLDIPNGIAVSGLGVFEIVVKLLEAEMFLSEELDHCDTSGASALNDAISMLYSHTLGDMFTDEDCDGRESETPIYHRALEVAALEAAASLAAAA